MPEIEQLLRQSAVGQGIDQRNLKSRQIGYFTPTPEATVIFELTHN